MNLLSDFTQIKGISIWNPLITGNLGKVNAWFSLSSLDHLTLTRGGCGGQRFHNLRSKSPLLCQLSYTPVDTLSRCPSPSDDSRTGGTPAVSQPPRRGINFRNGNRLEPPIGIEPRSPRYQRGALPLSYGGNMMAARAVIETTLAELESTCLPLTDRAIAIGRTPG